MKRISQSDYATYKNHRAEPYFTFVKNGQKTIEGRIKKGEYASVKPCDHIVVYNEETDLIEVVVKDTRSYASIEEMLQREPLNKILPGVETIEQAVEAYQRFYTKEQEQQFGVVAMEVERVKL